MDRRKLIGLILAALLALALPASAATYYVDADAADDLGAGTSPATAWKTITKVNASSFSAGDSILLERGDHWHESLTTPSAGADGNPITFGAYGTGAKPLLTGADDILGAAEDWADQTGNVWRKTITTQPLTVLFDGLAGTKGTIDATPDAQYEWTWGTNNFDVYSEGNPTAYYTSVNAAQRGNVFYVTQNYIAIEDIEATISNTDLFNINTNVQGTTGTGLVASYTDQSTGDCWTSHGTATTTLTDSELHHCTRGTTHIDTSVATMTGISFHHNTYGAYLTTGTATISDSDFEANQYGVRLHGVGTATVQRSALHGQTGTNLWLSAAGTLNLHYDLVYANADAAFYQTLGTANIFNCVFYDNAGAAAVFLDGGAATIKNTIMYETAGVAFRRDAEATYAGDYNIIYGAGSFINYSGTAYSVWATYQAAAAPQDANSLNVVPQWRNPATADYALLPTSTAINAGTDVSLTSDFIGRPVPIGAAPEIGAYEFQPITGGLRWW